MKEFYFHEHKPGQRQFTLCGLIQENGTLNIGVAMCSDKEQNFVKATGRSIARARAQAKPYDVIENFATIYGDNTVQSVIATMTELARRISANPSAIREISQLYHANQGMKKTIQPAKKPRFMMAELAEGTQAPEKLVF